MVSLKILFFFDGGSKLVYLSKVDKGFSCVRFFIVIDECII